MGKERFTSSTITTVIPEAPKEITEQAPKQDGFPNEAAKLLKEKHEKHFGSSGKGTEQAPKQDEAGKLLKVLAKFFFRRPGKGTEQVNNERRPIISGNPVNATDSHHAGVFNCNNGAQGGNNIKDNKIDAKASEYVGVFDCGNEYKKPNYFDISHLIFVCLVLLCFAMYKY
ncbi:hypothetical protein ACE6H2_006774 [Prunus campanulata]